MKCIKKSSRLISALVGVAFIFNTILPPVGVSAQTLLSLPTPGTMVTLSPAFHPPILKGLTIDPNNPLQFDFIINTGDSDLKNVALKDEAQKLVKYFLAALTVPEKDMWVNLSPYEKDRIIPQGLGTTGMGQDLLAQDYLLKQLTASLIYPGPDASTEVEGRGSDFLNTSSGNVGKNDLGKKFWQRVRDKVRAELGDVDIPMDTFNKVWIVPDRAVVYEYGKSVFVLERHLRVMLEEDYLALEKSSLPDRQAGVERIPYTVNSIRNTEYGIQMSEVIKDIILPEIEYEINHGKNFATLRQVYNSMILATWYKKRLRQGLLGQIYVDQNKTKGVDLEDKEIPQKIYDQYLEAFKKGVYNFIKEDYDPHTQQIIPRKYFSGGAVGVSESVLKIQTGKVDRAVLSKIETANGPGRDFGVSVALNDPAMTGKDQLPVPQSWQTDLRLEKQRQVFEKVKDYLQTHPTANLRRKLQAGHVTVEYLKSILVPLAVEIMEQERNSDHQGPLMIALGGPSRWGKTNHAIWLAEILNAVFEDESTAASLSIDDVHLDPQWTEGPVKVGTARRTPIRILLDWLERIQKKESLTYWHYGHPPKGNVQRTIPAGIRFLFLEGEFALHDEGLGADGGSYVDYIKQIHMRIAVRVDPQDIHRKSLQIDQTRDELTEEYKQQRADLRTQAYLDSVLAKEDKADLILVAGTDEEEYHRIQSILQPDKAMTSDQAMVGEVALNRIAERIVNDARQAVIKHKVSLVSRISQSFIDEVIMRLSKAKMTDELQEFEEMMADISGFFMYDAYNDQFVRIHASRYPRFLELARLAGFPEEDLNFEEFARVELSVAAAMQKKYSAELGDSHFNWFVHFSSHYQDFSHIWRIAFPQPWEYYDDLNLMPFFYVVFSRAVAAQMVSHQPEIFGTESEPFDLNEMVEKFRKDGLDFWHILDDIDQISQIAGFLEFAYPSRIGHYEYVHPSAGDVTKELPPKGEVRFPTPSLGGDPSGKQYRTHSYVQRVPVKGELILLDEKVYLIVSDPEENDGLVEAMSVIFETRFSGKLVETDLAIRLIKPENPRIRVILPEEDSNYKFQVGQRVILHDSRYPTPVPVTIINAGFGGVFQVITYQPVYTNTDNYLGRGILVSITDAHRGAFQEVPSDEAMLVDAPAQGQEQLRREVLGKIEGLREELFKYMSDHDISTDSEEFQFSAWEWIEHPTQRGVRIPDAEAYWLNIKRAGSGEIPKIRGFKRHILFDARDLSREVAVNELVGASANMDILETLIRLTDVLFYMHHEVRKKRDPSQKEELVEFVRMKILRQINDILPLMRDLGMNIVAVVPKAEHWLAVAVMSFLPGSLIYHRRVRALLDYSIEGAGLLFGANGPHQRHLREDDDTSAQKILFYPLVLEMKKMAKANPSDPKLRAFVRLLLNGIIFSEDIFDDLIASFPDDLPERRVQELKSLIKRLIHRYSDDNFVNERFLRHRADFGLNDVVALALLDVPVPLWDFLAGLHWVDSFQDSFNNNLLDMVIARNLKRNYEKVRKLSTVDAAMSAVGSGRNVGGINFDAAMLDLEIKRDGNGIPLPVEQQPLYHMEIDGFVPVIINITPISVPLLLGLNDTPEPYDLTSPIVKF